MSTGLTDILRQYWGYSAFRPSQEDAMQAAVDGRDVFVLFPTGGGKSLCYQIPALAQDGICIVISPLIALMQDQVQQLKDRGIKADYLHAGLSYFEIDRLLDNAIYGDTKLLYIAPERLKHPLTLERIKQMNINLLAVDESHCISQWGHDFRPAYREIGAIREVLRDVPVMALTATATPQVVADIQEQLLLKNPFIATKSFVRDNLHFIVRQSEDKIDQIRHILAHTEGAAIIYVRSRQKTVDLANELTKLNVQARAYHAGMSYDQRQRIMADWMQGKVRVICATNAFGMGVDKSDVRVVIHIEMPPSLEEYYQEAGRAGRDGERAYCVALYNEGDRINALSKYKLAFPSMEDIVHIYACLGHQFGLATGSGEGESFDFHFQSFVEDYQLGYQLTANTLRILEQNGWIALTDSFYRPSKVMMVADKMYLYDYQLKHKSAAIFIKTMLRTYEGLYSQFTRISEEFLARQLKSQENIVVQMLEQLQADEILDYEPKSSSAKITFLLPRSSKANFNIDKRLFEFRKNMMRKRLESVLNYLESEDCRMQTLLAYFGEHNTEPCGKCDRCIEKKNQPDEATYTKFKAIILKNIGQGVPFKDIMRHFPSNRHAQVRHVIERMEKEKWLERDNDYLVLHSSKQ